MDKKLLRDFSTVYDIDYIWDDIFKNYKITEYFDGEDGEYMYYLAEHLHYDLEHYRANYKAYIRKGMTARMLFELRKSMILHVFEDEFFDSHDKLKTPDEVIQYRTDYIRKFGLADYSEHDGNWQLYYFCMLFIGKERFDGLHLDFEPCFTDARYFHFPNYETYQEQKLDSNSIPHRIYKDERGVYLFEIDREAVSRSVLEKPAVEYIPVHMLNKDKKNRV